MLRLVDMKRTGLLFFYRVDSLCVSMWVESWGCVISSSDISLFLVKRYFISIFLLFWGFFVCVSSMFPSLAVTLSLITTV